MLCGDIAKAAYELFCKHFPLGTRVRMLGVTVSGFDYHVEQMRLDAYMGGSNASYEKKERAENAIAMLREKYGYATVQRGLVLEDEKLSGLDIRGKKEET
jgi:DNA polymerase-4